MSAANAATAPKADWTRRIPAPLSLPCVEDAEAAASVSLGDASEVSVVVEAAVPSAELDVVLEDDADADRVEVEFPLPASATMSWTHSAAGSE